MAETPVDRVVAKLGLLTELKYDHWKA